MSKLLDLQVVSFEQVLKPLVGLFLRVNAETVPLSVRDQDTILE